MHWPCRSHLVLTLLSAGLTFVVGCGVTRSTDTVRTATEQLLISDAIDRAVQTMNLQTLAGQSVFLDDSKLTDTVDRNYFISTLRQHLLATGCELRDKREEAEFVVEARAGAIGTDRNDLLFGLPSMNVPQIPLVQPVPAAIPEIPIAKRKDQRGVAKIAVFAYHRATGTPVWQSGIVRQESSANDVWIFGAGPFQRGTIYDGTTFAGNAIGSESPAKDGPTLRRGPAVSVTREDLFTSPEKLVKKTAPVPDEKIAAAAPQAPTPEAKAAPVPAPTPPATVSATPAAAAPAPNQSAAGATAPSKDATSPTPPPVSTASPVATAASGSTTPAGKQKADLISPALARVSDATPLPQPRFNSPR